MADLRETLHERIDKLCDDLVYTAPELWPERVHGYLTLIGQDIKNVLEEIVRNHGRPPADPPRS